MKEGG